MSAWLLSRVLSTRLLPALRGTGWLAGLLWSAVLWSPSRLSRLLTHLGLSWQLARLWLTPAVLTSLLLACRLLTRAVLAWLLTGLRLAC